MNLLDSACGRIPTIMEEIMRTLNRRPVLFAMVVLALSLMFAGLSQAASNKAHAKITAKQAESIVLKRYPGKIVEKTKLENEEGIWQYGVMVRSGKTLREVMVNAATGKIDNVEVTTSSKEKVEAKADAAKENAKGSESK